MQGERVTDIDSLMGAFGLGRRAATRVVALLSRKVDVTGTLLAQAGEDASVEQLLLTPEFLKSPDVLSTQTLRDRAAECGFGEWEILTLVADAESGWRTIALEDDLLAAQAAAESEVQSGVGGELVHAAPRQLSTRETQGLFTLEETAQLKLTVLTSQNLDERIEAVRKLVFAPMDSAQKAGIFLSVLTDREAEPKVCREAVRSL